MDRGDIDLGHFHLMDAGAIIAANGKIEPNRCLILVKTVIDLVCCARPKPL